MDIIEKQYYILIDSRLKCATNVDCPYEYPSDGHNCAQYTHNNECSEIYGHELKCAFFACCGGKGVRCTMYQYDGKIQCQDCTISDISQFSNNIVEQCNSSGQCIGICDCDCQITHGVNCDHFGHNRWHCPDSGWCCTLQQCRMSHMCGSHCPQYLLQNGLCMSCNNNMGNHSDLITIKADCPVCYNHLDMIELPCNHQLCPDCWYQITRPRLTEWGEVRYEDRCPLCRASNQSQSTM
jgi:hypothetical protein